MKVIPGSGTVGGSGGEDDLCIEWAEGGHCPDRPLRLCRRYAGDQRCDDHCTAGCETWGHP